MFRNEGKRSKGRFREEGSLEPFGPSPVAFPTEVSSCFFPASPLPKSPASVSGSRHPSCPSPHPGARGPIGLCAACTGSSRGGPPAQEEPGLGGTGAEPRLRGQLLPNHASLPQGRAGSANQLRQPRRAKRKWVLGLGIVGREPGPHWRSPLGSVRQEPAPCLARGTLACGICPAAP